MSAAYKSALRKGETESDSDVGMSSLSDEESSNTIQEGDSDDPNNSSDTTPPPKFDLHNLPIELRSRLLMVPSRGVNYRHRHLIKDLHALLPHSVLDSKLDTKSNNKYNTALNALADLHSCPQIALFESRKQNDLYLWLGQAPNGPTIKFSVSNVHTMAELGFGGNCLKGGRGVVVFDKSFEDGLEGNEHKTLIREMLKGVFCVPSKGVRGMKPFVDRVVGIYGLDGKIWIRIYEIRETEKDDQQDLPKGSTTNITLIEVGPRMVLTPIVILEGSFGGPVIYENKEYVSSNQLRSETRLRKASKYASRRGDLEERIIKKKSLGLESGMKQKRSKVDDVELFG